MYMDDMLIATNHLRDVIELKILLGNEFYMKDLGTAKKLLIMEIHTYISHGKWLISKKDYVERVLDKFDMINSMAMSIQLTNHFKLSFNQCPMRNA